MKLNSFHMCSKLFWYATIVNSKIIYLKHLWIVCWFQNKMYLSWSNTLTHVKLSCYTVQCSHCRAAMKMANIDAVFDYNFTYPKTSDGVGMVTITVNISLMLCAAESRCGRCWPVVLCRHLCWSWRLLRVCVMEKEVACQRVWPNPTRCVTIVFFEEPFILSLHRSQGWLWL